MNKQLHSHRSPSFPAPAATAQVRELAAGEVLRLGRGGGELMVLTGQLWLTRVDPDGPGYRERSGDHVLGAGQSIRLGAAQGAVIEPWCRDGVRVRWLPSPRGAAAKAQARMLRALAFLAGEAEAGLRGLARAFAALARSAASSASRAQGCISAGESIACSGAAK